MNSADIPCRLSHQRPRGLARRQRTRLCPCVSVSHRETSLECCPTIDLPERVKQQTCTHVHACELEKSRTTGGTMRNGFVYLQLRLSSLCDPIISSPGALLTTRRLCIRRQEGSFAGIALSAFVATGQRTEARVDLHPANRASETVRRRVRNGESAWS